MPTILVVDDDPNFIDMLKDYLGNLGYAVVAATDGSRIIDFVQRYKPDLVILDYQMPALRGDAVLVRLRGAANTAATPVIFVSATPVAEIQNKIDKGSVKVSPLEHFLTKPIDLHHLQEIVETLVGKAGKARN